MTHMRPRILLAGLILLAIVQVALTSASSQNYYGKLALTWPTGYCEQQLALGKKCDPNILKQWNGRSFTIHGFWPDLKSATPAGAFSLSALNPVMAQLKQFWPSTFLPFPNPSRPTFTQRYFLWQHEWQTHGGDFASIYQAVLGSTLPASATLRDQALELHYFQQTVKLYLTTTASNMIATARSKAELALRIGVNENMFITRCNPSGNLYEIQICTEFFKSGSSMTYIFIPCTSGRSNCPASNVLNLAGFH